MHFFVVLKSKDIAKNSCNVKVFRKIMMGIEKALVTKTHIMSKKVLPNTTQVRLVFLQQQFC